MIEIDLQLVTKQIGGITITDMVKTFGWRIKRAVYYDKDGKPEGLISEKMVKLMRWWKFWNNDIKKAYKRYTGLILVPWTIKYGNPEVFGDDDIIRQYHDKPINPDFYSTLNLTGELDHPDAPSPWEKHLEGLKPMDEDCPIIKLITPNENQKIEEDDN
jgi:hypothetical protein